MHRIQKDESDFASLQGEKCFIHPSAIVESTRIGSGTNIWAFVHIMSEAIIGNSCNVGDHGFVETGAVIGDNVTIKNHVCVWEGITIEDDVFVGPYVAFTNDLYPRSARMPELRNRPVHEKEWLQKTVVQRGCSIGANATILAGVCLGHYSMIAAGSVITRDVEPFALMIGSPARKVGYVCRCGERFALHSDVSHCTACGADLTAQFQSTESAKSS